MPRKKITTFINLWICHENLYIEVFSKSLVELSNRKDLTGDENAISAILYPILKQTCFKLGTSRNSEIQTPHWEQPIPPETGSNPNSSKKQKRPDFTIDCINTNAENKEEYELPFHIECKRIGKRTSTAWNLNKNYVINGITRFDSSEYEYGKYASSGLMIGYVINMSPDTILPEINSHLSKYSYFQLLAFPQFKKLSVTTQNIHRISVEPSRFKLQHLWIDLRQSYNAKNIKK